MSEEPTPKTEFIYCCDCNGKVDAFLIDGSEAYPHRPDLSALPFWKCPNCKNFVGCHHKTSNPTKPLGCIPNEQMKNARKHIHALIDPVWQSGKISRNKIYAAISEHMGWRYHTAQIRNLDEARKVYRFASQLLKNY